MSGRAHLLVALVIALTVLLILRMLRSGQLKSKYAILWMAVAVGLLPLAAFPDQVLVPISRAIGIAYEPATILFASIAFLFLVVVEFSWELSRLEERTRLLAEEVALLRARTESTGPASEASGSGAPSAHDETVRHERGHPGEGAFGAEQDSSGGPQGTRDPIS